MTTNWRTQVGADQFFGDQKKQSAVESRRPVIRKASDLVGPGIGSAAVVIADFNNQLATYNGYFSAEVGALNAPNDTEQFVGFVTQDATMGGVQTFTGLDSGTEYRRIFKRNPSDYDFLYWGSWEASGGAFVQSTGSTSTFVPNSALTAATCPTFADQPGVFERTATAALILSPGIYTGSLAWSASVPGNTLDILTITMPDGGGLRTSTETGRDVTGSDRVYVPLTFRTTGSSGQVSIDVEQSGGSSGSILWSDLVLTRVGNA